jgi:butyryl-CoA dehydrogenase
MKARALRDGDHFVLSGTKAFATNAGGRQVAVVMAITDPARRHKDISAFILEKNMPGFSAAALT